MLWRIKQIFTFLIIIQSIIAIIQDRMKISRISVFFFI
jgi:hypothetical protein